MADKYRHRGDGSAEQDADLLNRLEPLVANVEALREQARTLGMFAEERELLECSACGLREDVTVEGLLITYVGSARGKDSSLRFRETQDGAFVCPSCGGEVAHPEGES
jgi:hypothetical protein